MSYRRRWRGSWKNRLGVRACGFLPQLPECALESRHLGLITADEVARSAREDAAIWRPRRRKRMDLAALLEIARSAPPLGLYAAGAAGGRRAGAHRRGPRPGILLLL